MELSEIRSQLNTIDDDLLDLFLKRMNCVDQVAAIKKVQHQPLFDAKREREILMRIHDAAGEPFGNAAHQFFRVILELSRARQAELLEHQSDIAIRANEMLANEQSIFSPSGTVGIAGIEGSNAQIAADKLFSRGDLIYFDSFESVVRAVSKGLCQFGVLPVENSSNGSVRKVYDLLRLPNIAIVRGIRMMIRHVLLTQKDAKLSQIRTIYTHEQAAAQCSRFLSSLENVDVIPCHSTAHAAKRAAEMNDPTVAAIASDACAGLYGLNILMDDIQNEKHNDTRFLCVANGTQSYSGANKISLTFTLKNESGSLFDVIAKISALGINMSKLESIPIPDSNFSYRFYADLETSLHQNGVISLLSELERTCGECKLLGAYAEIAG